MGALRPHLFLLSLPCWCPAAWVPRKPTKGRRPCEVTQGGVPETPAQSVYLRPSISGKRNGPGGWGRDADGADPRRLAASGRKRKRKTRGERFSRKLCRRCGESKESGDFPRNGKVSDGPEQLVQALPCPPPPAPGATRNGLNDSTPVTSRPHAASRGCALRHGVEGHKSRSRSSPFQVKPWTTALLLWSTRSKRPWVQLGYSRLSSLCLRPSRAT
jgi:hypothetical protein